MDDDPYPLFSREYNPTGEQLRDEGIALVTANSGTWIKQAYVIVSTGLPNDWVGMAENYRPLVVGQIGEPHTPQTWGSLTRELIRRRVIAPIGQYWKPKDPKSHACPKPAYRKL